MKTSKRIIALLVSLVLLWSCSFSSFALDTEAFKASAYKSLMNVAETVVEGLINGLSLLFPTPREWKSAEETKLPGFFEGTENFINEPAENAKFSLGYDSRSLLENAGTIIGEMYVGGSIALSKKFATEIADDLKVRTAAISDGSGRGISLFIVLDAYGISLPDTRELRSKLSELANSKNINSITVTALHQHSAVDTLGMNGSIFEMVFLNPTRVLFGKETANGKNKQYMETLFETCKKSAIAATESMTEGEVYYGTAKQSDFLTDKRAPYVADESFNRFRFVPDNGGRETWISTTEIHCVGNGAAGTTITGDYPYYAEKEVEDKANLMFIMGAQQSTTQNHNENTVVDYREDMTRLEATAGFGKALGRHLASIKNETRVDPILNIRYKEILLPIDNPILSLAGKVGMFDALVTKEKDGLYVKSELGYMELGKDLSFAIIPGELAPELAYGGCLGEKEAWHGTDWQYPSMQEVVKNAGKNRTLRVIDLANDQVGYIVPDNNYIPMIASESGSIELVALGKRTASTIMTEFEALVNAD